MLSLIYPSVSVPVLPRPTAGGASRAELLEQSELLPVVEASGLVVGEAPRGYCHREGLLHPVVHLHLVNRSGHIYLQRRALEKDSYPGYWDTAVGGHVGFGESLEETLFRESREEISLDAFNPVFLLSYVYQGPTERELTAVYAAVGNFHPVPRGEEVMDGRWWKVQEIEDNLGKSIFTPTFEEDFGKIHASMEALL